MTDAYWTDLGRRAIALGMPEAIGLMCGATGLRRAEDFSWPHFADPITEAWLVAWAAEQSFDKSHGQTLVVGGSWGGHGHTVWRRHVISAEGPEGAGDTAAEAWIVALEKMKGFIDAW